MLFSLLWIVRIACSCGRYIEGLERGYCSKQTCSDTTSAGDPRQRPCHTVAVAQPMAECIKPLAKPYAIAGLPTNLPTAMKCAQPAAHQRGCVACWSRDVAAFEAPVAHEGGCLWRHLHEPWQQDRVQSSKMRHQARVVLDLAALQYRLPSKIAAQQGMHVSTFRSRACVADSTPWTTDTCPCFATQGKQHHGRHIERDTHLAWGTAVT